MATTKWTKNKKYGGLRAAYFLLRNLSYSKLKDEDELCFLLRREDNACIGY